MRPNMAPQHLTSAVHSRDHWASSTMRPDYTVLRHLTSGGAFCVALALDGSLQVLRKACNAAVFHSNGVSLVRCLQGTASLSNNGPRTFRA